jgi:hypothetical protein
MHVCKGVQLDCDIVITDTQNYIQYTHTVKPPTCAVGSWGGNTARPCVMDLDFNTAAACTAAAAAAGAGAAAASPSAGAAAAATGAGAPVADAGIANVNRGDTTCSLS